MTKKTASQADYLFITLLGVILVFGLIMLSSASTAVAYQRFQDNYYYLKHQFIFGIIPGLAAFFILSRVDYKIWRKMAFFSLILSIFLLVAVFLPGIGFNYGGATRWIHFGSLTLQPAEIVKLAYLIYLASWMEKRENGLRNLSGVFPFLATLGLITFLIIKQPDIGTMSIIVLTSLSVYFVAGARWKHLLGLAILGVTGIWALIKLAPYRAARLTVFLNPALDPQGIGYHINQALLAVGSGGLFGVGLGLSRQKHLYLPEVIGDSIYAVIAEELGFVFGGILIILFGLLVYQGIKIARRSPDLFSRYLALGIASWIGLQVIINVGAMIGFLPLTGLPLPFVSYGSTSMIVLLSACGIMVNISKSGKVTKRLGIKNK